MDNQPPLARSRRTLFLLPKGAMLKRHIREYSRQYPEIVFRSLDPISKYSEAETIAQEGFDIVVARGNTADELRKLLPNIYVINFNITAYDVLRLIIDRKFWGKTIGLITVRMNISGLELVSKVLGVKILDYTYTPLEGIEARIRECLAQGASVIIGGTLSNIAGKRMGVPIHVVPIGPECMQDALDKVHQVQDAIQFEESRQNYWGQLLDNLIEGVISVDADNKVTAINRAAEKIICSPRRELLNKSVRNLPEAFWEEFKITREESVIRLNQTDYVCIQTPILEDSKICGGIFTLYEKSNVERMEHTVRVESYVNEHNARYKFSDVIGESDAIRRIIYTSKKYASTNSNILITGESGTGKELFAQSIHNASQRKRNPFVAINCAAFPRDILPSELFGYVEGAFTGASRKGKPGLFEIANYGTVFLDEIAEMDYNTQVNLLRVVQERYVIRLGSHRPININCRIIAATNKDLPQLVREGKFREDLFFRLNVLSLEIPPLRSRKCDIIPILLHYLNKNNFLKKNKVTISREACELLQSYSWPGNIREVCNIAERLLAILKTTHIESKDLRQVIQPDSPLWLETRHLNFDPRQARHLAQKKESEEMLAACGGNASLAASRLGISRSTLWRRLRRA